MLADRFGVLVEKDIRFLSRAPRFRLVFLMGFTFGLLIWLPLAFGRDAACAADEVDRGRKSGLAEVKERIRKFRRELLNYSVDQDDPEQVVQINFQLFPLTARRDES